MKHKSVAFIPARSGSKRIPDKNIKLLNGHPMLAYSIRAAIDSGIFDSVICATDNELYAEIAKHYGAEVPFLRPSDISGDKSPDIDWVLWALNNLKEHGREYDIFSILRPTSPFRLPETIRRAWDMFIKDSAADSLRALEKCKQHPGKMWVIHKNRMLPLMPFTNESTPWHSSQYSALPEIYAQDASLELAWTRVPVEKNSIAGDSIIPFVSNGYEGFDINNLEDWMLAETLIKQGEAKLPLVDIKKI
jgi:N-acylneuraminate cytidylyltransferase